MSDETLTPRDHIILRFVSQGPSGVTSIAKQCAYAGLPLVGYALRTRLETLCRLGYLREEATVLPGGERVVLYAAGERAPV